MLPTPATAKHLYAEYWTWTSGSDLAIASAGT
jgi:hypothetical protein